jgi:hypothetical protein
MKRLIFYSKKIKNDLNLYFYEINKMHCKIISVITTIFIGICTGIYYATLDDYSTNFTLSVKGIQQNDLIFFNLENGKVSYDTLKKSSINSNFLLNRFFNLNSEYVMVETLLDGNYNQISDWEYIDTDVGTNNFIISKSGNTISVDVMFDIIYKNDIPVKINDYDIIKYNNTRINDFVYSNLQNIKSPSLNVNNLNRNLSSLVPPDIDAKCLIELTYKAMTSGKDLVAYGKCSGYNVVGVPGTDFKNIKDIIANIKGATYDNYKSGFDNLKNFDFKIYDFCAGYSLGGAIAKYMALIGYCKNVITFASPLTSKYNMDIPIIQYVNTIDDTDGCCKRDWSGKCLKKGMFLTDPVTLIFKGTHVNIKYIGKRQNDDCIGSFAYTIWKQGFDLHLISSYEPNL